jgi:hypothetical protein
MRHRRLILGALAIGSGHQAIRNIDVNTYRALIASQVETMTGRPVTIAGNVEVSPSLHPSIVIEQVSLANPGWARGRRWSRSSGWSCRPRGGLLQQEQHRYAAPAAERRARHWHEADEFQQSGGQWRR